MVGQTRKEGAAYACPPKMAPICQLSNLEFEMKNGVRM